MPKTRQQIVDDIQGHIAKRGGVPGEWYVGVGTAERARLFEDHRVDEKRDWWIVRRAESPQAAREASIDLAGTLRNATGGNAAENTIDFVYAFRRADADIV